MILFVHTDSASFSIASTSIVLPHWVLNPTVRNWENILESSEKMLKGVRELMDLRLNGK